MGKLDQYIEIKGANTHNLKNVDLQIPVGKITCIGGPSGSGKTSLAFHTLLVESKRRLINSFPSSLKFFTDRPPPAQVDSIRPILPVFGLAQNNPVLGSRSVILDNLAIGQKLEAIFYALGSPGCPDHILPLRSQDFFEGLNQKLSTIKGKMEKEVLHVFVKGAGFKRIYGEDYYPSRSLGQNGVSPFEEQDEWWELCRLKVENGKVASKKLDFLEQLEGLCEFKLYFKGPQKNIEWKFKGELGCPKCDYYIEQRPKRREFSPMSPLGACANCKGYGSRLEYDPTKIVPNDKKSINQDAIAILKFKRFNKYRPLLKKFLIKNGVDLNLAFKDLPDNKWELLYKGGDKFPGLTKLCHYLEQKKYKKVIRIFSRNYKSEYFCEQCEGTRFNRQVGSTCISNGKKSLNYRQFNLLSIAEAEESLLAMKDNYLGHIKKMNSKELENYFSDCIFLLHWAKSFGLGYLKLSAKTKDLTPSEYQRLLLIKFLSFKGSGSLFVFDEPSLGLAPDEQEHLLQGLEKLKEQGNTVVIIDHNPFFHKNSDRFVLMGPGAGHQGGEVLYSGKYLKKYGPGRGEDGEEYYGPKKAEFIKFEKLKFEETLAPSFQLLVDGVNWVHGGHDDFRLSTIIKLALSSLNYEISGEHLIPERGKLDSLVYPEKLRECFLISADSLRGTSRSNVGSITGISPLVRKHLAALPVSKLLNLKDGHFSPNSQLGQCLACEGKGAVVHDMHFLEDIVTTCDECGGRRLANQYAEISDGKLLAYEYFTRPIGHVLENIRLTPKYQKILMYLKLLNLDYLSLSREIPSLSGGEKQRINLLGKLQGKIENSLLFFENISFGLSWREVNRVGSLLRVLAERGNTIVVLDQNPGLQRVSDFELHFSGGKLLESRITS